MKRITYKILQELETQIKGFWEDFVLGPAYEYYSVGSKWGSGVRKMDEGLTAREAYYWMMGFISAYYKIKDGEITPPRFAPKGRTLWVVNHSIHNSQETGENYGTVNIVLAPEDMDQVTVEELTRPKEAENFSWFMIPVTEDRVWVLNSPIDTKGEEDGI